MKTTSALLMYIIEEGRSLTSFNMPLLVSTFAVLILALIVCIYISRKNKLYMKPKKKEAPINRNKIYKEKEVAS